jgi:ferredoxin-NADP reductase
MPRRIPCQVAEVIAHGEHVYTVVLSPATRSPVFFPGQFLHLALDPFHNGDFWPESRVFSIANAPSDGNALRITYAVKGNFTTRMEKELHPGAEVWVKLPYGEFLVARDKDVCLIAGGTGITAFTAFLGGMPSDYPHNVYLFYGARRPDMLIYRTLTEEWALRCPHAHLRLFSEELTIADAPLQRGRVDIEGIWRLLPCPDNLTYYLAGPPAMNQGLTQGLVTKGVDARQIITDAWE